MYLYSLFLILRPQTLLYASKFELNLYLYSTKNYLATITNKYEFFSFHFGRYQTLIYNNYNFIKESTIFILIFKTLCILLYIIVADSFP